jgi:hypothetical protein
MTTTGFGRLLTAVLLGAMLAGGAASAQMGPPPPPPIERYGPPPHPGWAWRGGFYRWDGRRYIWVPGYWVRPPRPAAVWVPGHWVAGPRGWYYVPGHWRY